MGHSYISYCLGGMPGRNVNPAKHISSDRYLSFNGHANSDKHTSSNTHANSDSDKNADSLTNTDSKKNAKFSTTAERVLARL